jgi:hypothetical protein
MSRYDPRHFDRLVARGFVAELGDGWYALTAPGRASADLGLDGFTEADAGTKVPERPRGRPGRRREEA